MYNLCPQPLLQEVPRDNGFPAIPTDRYQAHDVLVPRAFADASSREGVIERLQQRGYIVVASISGPIKHNLPQEAPQAFVEAVLEVGGGVA